MPPRFLKITAVLMLATVIPVLVGEFAYQAIKLDSLGATPVRTDPLSVLQNAWLFLARRPGSNGEAIATVAMLTVLALSATCVIWALRKNR